MRRSTLFGMAAACVFGAGNVLGQGSPVPSGFETWTGYDVGYYPTFGPSSMAIGDLDGDAIPDVVAGLEFFGDPGLSLLKGDGNGGFALPTLIRTGRDNTVADVALADIDGDSDLDVIGAMPGGNYQFQKVAVWRNEGGVLSARVEYPTGAAPTAIAMADHDRDGRIDIATAGYGRFGAGSTVSVLRNTGGGFAAPVSFDVGPSPERLETGDVNADQFPDLVVGRTDGRLAVLINDRAGGFEPAVFYTVPETPRSTVALIDLDQDGDLDLLGAAINNASSINYGLVVVFRNNSAGSFSGPDLYRMDNFSSASSDYAFADLNRDGWVDVIGCDPNGRATDGIRILFNDKAGGLSTTIYYPAAQTTLRVAAADVNGDGEPEVLSLSRFSSEVTVHAARPDGTLVRAPAYTTGTSLGNDLDAGDLDHDGDLDLAMSTISLGSGGSIAIMKNAGDGAFPTPTVYSAGLQALGIKVRDLNGDGHLDLLWADAFPPYDFRTMTNDGAGGFTGSRRIFPAGTCGNTDVNAFDLDNDGDNDVVLAEGLGCVSVPQSGRRLYVFRNDGQGNFTFVRILLASVLVSRVEAADLNNDGFLDVVTRSNGLDVFLGHGDLTFEPVIASGSGYYAFDLADMNGDAKTDAVVSVPADSFGTDQVGIALGNGDGTFQPAVLVPASSVLEALRITTFIRAADVNGDGIPDIVTANYASNDHSVFLSNGEGMVGPQRRYGSGNGPLGLVTADLTGDERIDIAAVIGDPPSGLPSSIAVLRQLKPVCPVDYTADGIVDFADYLEFLNLFDAMDPLADLNRDGLVDFGDYLEFLNLFDAGC